MLDGPRHIWPRDTVDQDLPPFPPSPFPLGTVLGTKEIYGRQRSIVPSPRDKCLHSFGCSYPLT